MRILPVLLLTAGCGGTTATTPTPTPTPVVPLAIVNDAAHLPYVAIPDDLIPEMVASGFAITPTLTVFDAYGALEGASSNLTRFVAAGGQVALGNDYSSVPQNGFDHFELGVADVLVVDGDPLTDLSALARVRLVLHDGVMIRGGS